MIMVGQLQVTKIQHSLDHSAVSTGCTVKEADILKYGQAELVRPWKRSAGHVSTFDGGCI